MALSLSVEEWKKTAFANLVDFASLMKRRQIPFWLDYGTLLGAYRDGDLVPWMEDVDLGMLDSSWPEVRSGFQELSAAGFEIHERRFCVGDVTFHAAKFMRNGVNVDLSVYVSIKGRAVDLHERLKYPRIYFLAGPVWITYQQLALPSALRFALRTKNRFFSSIFRRVDALPPKARFGLRYGSRWVLWRPTYYTASLPMQFYSGFTKIELGGREYPVPARTEEYLEYLYGPKWDRPDPAYRIYDTQWFNLVVTERPIECPLEPSPHIDMPH